MYTKLILACDIFIILLFTCFVSHSNADHVNSMLCCEKNEQFVCSNLQNHEFSNSDSKQLCNKTKEGIVVENFKQLNLKSNTSLWCLSKLDSEYQLFPCDLNVNKQNRRIDNLFKLPVRHKCCPLGYIYRGDIQQCVRQTFNIALAEQSENPLAVIANDFSCPNQQVIVEYNNVPAGQLDFRDMELLFMKQRYGLNLYCVEPIINTTEFLVRVCANESICQRIPCINRCCGLGQVYDFSTLPPSCVQDNSIFESFSGTQFKLNFAIPRGKFQHIINKNFRIHTFKIFF